MSFTTMRLYTCNLCGNQELIECEYWDDKRPEGWRGYCQISDRDDQHVCRLCLEDIEQARQELGVSDER